MKVKPIKSGTSMTDEIEGIFKSTKTLITDYLMSEVGEILLPLLYLFIDFFFLSGMPISLWIQRVTLKICY